MSRTVAIIQARTSSTRLPGKVLKPVCNQSVLAHVINRARAIGGLSEVAVATSTRAEDRVIVALADSMGAPCFTGSEQDVLDRYYEAAQRFHADAVVRITADCPLLDPGVSWSAIERFHAGDADYASNMHPQTFPDGLDTEVMSMEALQRAWREATLESDREHVTPYFYNNPGSFRLANVEGSIDHSGKRWTIDYPEDLDFVRAVYERLYRPDCPPFGMSEVLGLLQREPELALINAR